MNRESALAARLGTTRHVSSLLLKAQRLRRQYPSPTAAELEDWLLDQANARGATVVTRLVDPVTNMAPIPAGEFSNEELVVAICHPNGDDRPQALRAAAQLVSRGDVDAVGLVRVVRRERAELVLLELARQALRVEPGHAIWGQIRVLLDRGQVCREPILHWTRLAHPRFAKGRPNAVAWTLAT